MNRTNVALFVLGLVLLGYGCFLFGTTVHAAMNGLSDPWTLAAVAGKGVCETLLGVLCILMAVE